MADRTTLRRLLEIERQQRDSDWAKALVAELLTTPLAICEPQVDRGPDGFLYLGLALEDAENQTTLADVFSYCTETAHCGLVLFRDTARADPPEWVFSLGDLWSLRMFGSIDGDPNDLAALAEANREPSAEGQDQQVLLAAPSETYLPEPMKQALTDFLVDILELPEAPDIGLLVVPSLAPPQNLLLKLGAASFRDAAHQDAVLHAVSWFLPRHRGVMFLPDGWSA
ncbi:MAG: hypothetical protein R3D30_01595 [Hyphomicrobiales bacterium]